VVRYLRNRSFDARVVAARRTRRASINLVRSE
jgi:hypothetical protein